MAGLIQNPEGDNPFVHPDHGAQTARGGAEGDGRAALHHAGPGGPGHPGAAADGEALGRAAARQRVGREGPGGPAERPAARGDAPGAARQGPAGRAEGLHDRGPEPAADGRRGGGGRAAIRHVGLRCRARRDGPEDGLREGDDRQPAVRRSRSSTSPPMARDARWDRASRSRRWRRSSRTGTRATIRSTARRPAA